jgi:hypothetical protein
MTSFLRDPMEPPPFDFALINLLEIIAAKQTLPMRLNDANLSFQSAILASGGKGGSMRQIMFS